MQKKFLNLGILAHVDAGKTSLTERLLFNAGVLAHLGAVDSGDTHTDSHELEQQRGITIQSSVVSFNINQTQINLIDTPGHADFISEVERALLIIDAVVLVISAVEGIQAQTRVLMSTLKRLQKPTLIFVNKVDRPGAKTISLIHQINKYLNIAGFPMVRVSNAGTAEAKISHLSTKDSDYYNEIIEALSAQDENFLKKCIDQNLNIKKIDLLEQILNQTGNASLYPIYFGSAATGAGIDELCVGIEHYVPPRYAQQEAAPIGTLFKIDYNNAHKTLFYINLEAGVLSSKQTITLYRQTEQGIQSYDEKISDLAVFKQGNLCTTQQATAGHIVCLKGLQQARIGDTLSLCAGTNLATLFARPTLETTVTAVSAQQQAQLFAILKKYEAEDPLISLYHNQHCNSINIKLYGEIQQQIIQSRLATEHGIEVCFSNTHMICVERPIRVGKASYIMDLHNAPLEFYASLGFSIEPGAIDSGIQYNAQAHRGRIPKGYLSVVKESVYKFLKSGLHGWAVTDCIITMTDSGVCPLSIAPHFRKLTPILLQQALEQAQTTVCEPYSKFELQVPIKMLNTILVEIAKFEAKVLQGQVLEDTYTIQGEVLSKHIHTIKSLIPGLTQGRGTLLCHHAGYISRTT